MQRALLAAAVAAALWFEPGAASAQEGTAPDWANKSGAIGLGANTTLGGVNGINLRTYIGPLFGLHLTLGFNWDSATVDNAGTETDISILDFQVGLYGSYKLAYWQRGHLSLLFGIDIVTLSESAESGGTTVGEQSATDFLIGLGVMGEYFPTQYLSLFAEGGIRMDIESGSEPSGIPDEPVETSGFEMSLRSDLFGQAGFTVWFK